MDLPSADPTPPSVPKPKDTVPSFARPTKRKRTMKEHEVNQGLLLQEIAEGLAPFNGQGNFVPDKRLSVSSAALDLSP